jgi:hypothetical protein
VWCVRKPGRDLKEKIELWLAWKRVEKEINDGTLGGDFDRADRSEITAKVRDAEEAAKDEVWASYRFVLLADSQEGDGLKIIDLGAGHASASETLCGRVVTALKSQALLNESPGASYLERRWPPAFKESGAWPLASLRQAFLTGAMERLLDPDIYLRNKLPDFVLRGDFGLASGLQAGGGYTRVWFSEMLPPEEVAFDADVYLLTKAKAKALKMRPETESAVVVATSSDGTEGAAPTSSVTSEDLFFKPEARTIATADSGKKTLQITGTIPPEIWNRLGTKLLPKLKAGSELRLGLDFTLGLDTDAAAALQLELRQIFEDLNLTERLQVKAT